MLWSEEQPNVTQTKLAEKKDVYCLSFLFFPSFSQFFLSLFSTLSRLRCLTEHKTYSETQTVAAGVG